MTNYVMMYAISDPDVYRGHRIKHIQADSLEAAEAKGYEWLEGLCGKGGWEYMIAENPSSYRVYDTKKHKRV